MSGDPWIVQFLQMAILLGVGAAGAGVVLTREPVAQSVTITFYGLLLALFFVLYQAPDVALSQIVVGAVAVPLMLLLALAKIRAGPRRTEGGS